MFSEFLRLYPEVAKLRSWRQEVEETFNAVESFNAVRIIRAYICSSFWEFDSPIEFFRVLKSLCSAREVNTKLKKQYVYCIHNVYVLVDSRLLNNKPSTSVKQSQLIPWIITLEEYGFISAIERAKWVKRSWNLQLRLYIFEFKEGALIIIFLFMTKQN